MDAKLLEELSPVRWSVRRLLVLPDEAGMRLDRYLGVHNPGASISLIQRWLRTGQTRVNGGRVRGGYRLVAGEEVRIPPFLVQAMASGTEVPEWAMQSVSERIVWQDEQVLVLDKPHGIPVHGGSGQSWGMVDAVRAVWQKEGQGVVPELCHRLDKETSGCLLFALDKRSARSLTEAFRLGKVDKVYVALVQGRVHPEIGVIDQPLFKGMVRGGERMVVAGEGQDGQCEARTRYRVVKHYKDLSLLDVFLETGRTHQIRVHMQWLGHPVAGDEKYGDAALNRVLRQSGLKRMFLHARQIRFDHPITGEKLALEAPLDSSLSDILKTLSHRC